MDALLGLFAVGRGIVWLSVDPTACPSCPQHNRSAYPSRSYPWE